MLGSHRIFLVTASLALVLALSACSQEAQLVEVRELAQRDTPVRGVVKVPGVIRQAPVEHPDGTLTFRLFSEDSQTESVPVVFDESNLPRLPDDGITGLVAIVTGEFDGNGLIGEQLLLKTNTGPYDAGEPAQDE